MDLEAKAERVRSKLAAARSADPEWRVFGASSHRYRIHQPLEERLVAAFESQHGLSLPEGYRIFLTRIGNGGCSFAGSAAGPSYGIYPLGGMLDEIVHRPAEALRRAPRVTPGLSDEAWAALTERLLGGEVLPEDEIEAERARLFGGILPLGSQGCTYLHGLVLSGPHRGRVVNLDLDLQRPRFAQDAGFLEWYERWLDEVISGKLQAESPAWFGHEGP